MCKRPDEPMKEEATKEVHSPCNGQEVTPTHSAKKRNTDHDWLLFFGPALFWKVTPVWSIYTVVLIRILSTHVILSLNYMFVDKDNYLKKISQKQLQREKDDYLTAYYIHMWIQLALQVIFPTMFFSDDSEIVACAKEAFWAHMLLVEPLYYAVHRWLHVPKQMKAMHGFHHLSINTLPSTSLVQNLHEHVVYVATFGPAFFLPFLVQGRQHWVVIGGYLILFDIVNAWGHTNVIIRNSLFTSPYSPLTYFFYTPEFHQGHHVYFNANYSLFVPFWDYLCGTYREYRKKGIQLLPEDQQDFVFIGHNAGLGHLFTIPEICYYNVYNDYMRSWLPLKLELFIMHIIRCIFKLFVSFYHCSRFCFANEYIGRIIVLTRTPWDYMTPRSYDTINKEMVQLMRQEYDKFGTRYFGLGNLNKMKQLNDGGKDIARMVKEDPYLKDKNIRVWTGDTMTVASVYHQIADISGLDSLFYIGAGGKVGTAVVKMLAKNRPNMKIRIFSRGHTLKDLSPNVSYSSDLSEMTKYKVVLAGKLLCGKMYQRAFADCDGDAHKTRYVLDYTVPALPIDALNERGIEHIRIGLLKTDQQNNHFLKGHYDFCMSHPENHIVPCHFGCLLNTILGREKDEVGDIELGEVDKLWQMTLARGFKNITVDYK